MNLVSLFPQKQWVGRFINGNYFCTVPIKLLQTKTYSIIMSGHMVHYSLTYYKNYVHSYPYWILYSLVSLTDTLYNGS